MSNALRKVRTRDGEVAMVTERLSHYSIVQTKSSHPWYVIRQNDDLRDIPEEEFVGEFGPYK